MDLAQFKLQDPYTIGINLVNVQHLIVLPKISNLSQNNSALGDSDAQEQLIDQTERDMVHIDMIH